MSITMQVGEDVVFEVDMSGVVSNEILRAIEAGYWIGEPMHGDCMRHCGIYSDKGASGMLFTISVPSCDEQEALYYKLGRGIFGFLELDGLIWFTLLTNAGTFDAPFAAFPFDIGTRVLIDWTRSGSLQYLKLVYLDGTSVRAVRTISLDGEWLASCGKALGRLPFIDDPKVYSAAIASGAGQFDTMAMIAQSTHLKF